MKVTLNKGIVLVTPLLDSESTTESGLIVDLGDDGVDRGILASDQGEFKEGCVVIFKKDSGVMTNMGGQDYQFVDTDDILGIMTET